MRELAARYAALLRQPDVARIMALTFVSRMPIGTLTLSLLLHLRALTGSFAVAGSVVGSYLATSAIAAPFIGRWVDRRGPTAPLAVTGVLFPACIGVLLFADALGGSVTLMHVAAATAGAFVPPIAGLVRTVARERFEGDERRTAFALDSVLVEMVFTVGPLLVALMLATGSARAALAMSWVFTLASVPLFVASRALRWLPRRREAPGGLLGPAADPKLLRMFLVTVFIAVGFGCMEVGYPAVGVALGVAAVGGVLIAVNSVGSALGGLVYGGLELARSPAEILPRVLAVMAVPLALQATTLDPWLIGPLAFCTGVLIAPALTSVMLMIGAQAAQHHATEAFTWSTTCIIGGIGAGTMLAGHLVDTYGPRAVFVLGAAAIAAAALAALPIARDAARAAAAAPAPPTDKDTP